MTSIGTVRVWLREEGWGILDSPDTPGGCWTHFSHLVMDGERTLAPGESVQFDWEQLEVDGLPFRASRVWPGGGTPSAQRDEDTASAAYRSFLSIEFDS